jgi:hypothetical protein
MYGGSVGWGTASDSKPKPSVAATMGTEIEPAPPAQLKRGEAEVRGRKGLPHCDRSLEAPEPDGCARPAPALSRLAARRSEAYEPEDDQQHDDDYDEHDPTEHVHVLTSPVRGRPLA